MFQTALTAPKKHAKNARKISYSRQDHATELFVDLIKLLRMVSVKKVMETLLVKLQNLNLQMKKKLVKQKSMKLEKFTKKNKLLY